MEQISEKGNSKVYETLNVDENVPGTCHVQGKHVFCRRKIICIIILVTITFIVLVALATSLGVALNPKPKDCGDPPVILNGIVTETSISSSERRFSVVCDQGYSINGSSAVICETNGDWSKSALCLPLSCGNISAPTNGHILSITDIVYGGRVTVGCNEGYIMNGSEIVNCLSSGTWDEQPSCYKLDCGDPPVILNGIVTETPTSSCERRFSVVCDQGYSIYGSSAVICETNGNWSKPALCLPLSCGNISAPTNGHILSITDIVYGGRVTVGCNEGYIINGSEIVNCLSSGTWDEQPSCYKLVIHQSVYHGTSFITGFMEGHGDPTLLIACPELKALINVSIPALGIINEQHQLTNGALTLTYSDWITSTVSGQISNNSAYITADRPIVLFAGRLTYSGSVDGSLVMPEILLETHYILSGTEEYLIVGTVDQTFIWIFNNMNTFNTRGITLNRMETFMLAGTGFTGTLISSSAPVYVISGHTCANIPNISFGDCDYMDEEMPPLSSLGTRHVVSFMAPRPDFTISIAVPYDNTFVTIYNATGTVVETTTVSMKTASIFRSYTGFQSISIISTQPVLVTQYGHGQGSGEIGDSSMMTIPDVSHFGNLYDFVVPHNFTSTVAMVINSSYSITDLLLDGVAFSLTQTINVTIIGYGKYVVLYGDVLPGYHRLVHTAGNSVSFGAWIYGRSQAAEYACSLGHT